MGVYVKKGTKKELGHCLSCSSSDHYITVYEIELNSLTLRVCRNCRKELIRKLKES
jgi:hypothetical protein